MPEESDILAVRREKLAALRERGLAYPSGFDRSALAAELHTAHADTDKATLEAEPESVKVAGRVMLRRVMGRASFITLQDRSGRIQCYLRSDDIGDAAYADFRELYDIGDIVGVAGTLMRTNRGELTVAAKTIRMLTKALRPLPEKYRGLADTELKYRQRYLDLIMSDESRSRFAMRSRLLAELRRFFDARGYLEVETPMMHPIPGGAAARPFVTRHNALDMELYLRIAPELYLKRLTVGGFERVYEINRSFRNEGLSRRHNPEFTMLEFYQAYSTFEDLMRLTEEMMREVATTVTGSAVVSCQGVEIDFGAPAERHTMAESLVAHTHLASGDLVDRDRLEIAAREMHVEVEADWGYGKILTELFERHVEHKLVQPTFITHYPTEVSPLARRSDADSGIAERFEYFVGGREIANGFSEINDPDDQAARFRAQAELKSRGDDEAMHYDADYVAALEYGMPPTAGEGVGVDRLMMLLSDASSIRDVLLFPQMRKVEP